ncbi:MFS transporter [Arthrobacter sp. zg-Y820]|uniref:MFS transporter n=1 Tax=unclassified Arthrobacter TaxID=235627 RepID=UPI001E339F3D|nr:MULTISPECIES: MFS transporter [unclassified Arthrobacter]MCC9198574.1 MFS transporter [Arthrobacter sp. zg-Y820]MDK1281444.1 MFS transporter [Arthrobacter sp. zg.Y820]WIB09886.1 MFS transporter [Arthrobacter sp. zg-Y820]
MSESRNRRAGRRAAAAPLTLWAAAAVVVLVALNLRAGATSVGPVLAELQSALGMGSALAGVLTALPGLTFAVVGALAVALARRAGLNGTIAAGVAIVAAGLLLRSVVDSAVPFLLLTALAFAGMAVGNILVPAFIKRHGGTRTALLNSVYGTTLAVGATLPLLIAAPLAASGPDGWQVSLRVWGATALVAVVPWTVIAFRGRRSRTESTGTDGGTEGLASAPDGGTAGLASDGGRLRLTSSRTAVALCVYFGVQSMNAYVQFGWVAQIYRDAGLSQTQAGFMMAIIAALGIPGGLIMPALVARAPGLRFYVAALAAATGAGYLGLLLAPDTVPWLWALLLGAGGFAFPTALALITGRSRDPRVTAELSGFCQPVGYLLAAVGPFAIGALHAATESWALPLIILIGFSVAMAAAGVAAAAPRFVDDQLSRNPAQGT